jgi:hypothetical protein
LLRCRLGQSRTGRVGQKLAALPHSPATETSPLPAIIHLTLRPEMGLRANDPQVAPLPAGSPEMLNAGNRVDEAFVLI